MPVTLDQVNTYHTDRDNDGWAALAGRRTGLLRKAIDYVAVYFAPLRAEAEEDPRYLWCVAELALTFATNPPASVVAATVKREAKEGAGFKKEVEYFEPIPSDAYPVAAAIIAPLRAGVAVQSVSFGKLVR